MIGQTDPHAAPAEAPALHPRCIKAAPEGRMAGCPPANPSRRVGPLAFGLALGAVLWLAIGLFSWQFFR